MASPHQSPKEPSPTQATSQHPRQARTTPMQLLNLSMPRTGTASIMEALRILNIPCYHGLTLIARTSDGSTETDLWCRALDVKYYGKGAPFTRNDWDELLGEFGAVCDVPAICFAEELIEVYPEAKVLLVERELDAWEKSFDEGIVRNVWDPYVKVVAALDRGFIGRLRSVFVRWRGPWMGPGCHDAQSMRGRARAKYREHYELVERVTPRERLLKYRLGEGWEPLCKLLGKEVPTVEFPRVNESEALKEFVRGLLRKGLNNFVWKLIKVLGPVLAIGLAVLIGKDYFFV